MSVRSLLRNRLAWLLVATVACGVLVAEPVSQWLDRNYAVGLARQIETASDDEVRAQADAILLLDEMGWRAAARMLTSSRAEVAKAVASAMQARLDAPTGQITPAVKSRYLAAALVALAEEKRPIAEEVQPTVRQWCEHVLRLRPDAAVRPSDAAILVAACEKLLLEDSANRIAAQKAEEPRLAQRESLLPNMMPIRSDDVKISLPPGEPLPEEKPAPRDPDEPRPFVAEPTPVRSVEPRRFIPSRVPEVPKNSPDLPSATPLKRVEVEGQTTSALMGISLRRAADADVMQALWSEQASEAREELTRRGYQPLHVQLAQDITSPDPAVRLIALRKIPRTPGIRAKQWVEQLMNDPDPRVANTARTILAAGSQ